MSTPDATIDPHAGSPTGHAGVPLGEGRAVVVLAHGRNAAPPNILELASAIDVPGVTYLAPAAANRTWYPLSFLAERQQNEPFLSSALRRLGGVVADIEAANIPRHRIVLGGFSQGACLSSEFLYRNPGRYGGLVVLSGGLIGPPGTTWDATGALDGTPVFLGCSDIDAHIPATRVQESAAVFARLGASVTTRLYPGMGHLVNADEVEVARAIIATAAS